MFSLPERRRPTINRRQSVIFLVARKSNPIREALSGSQWLITGAFDAARAEQGARELTDAGQLPDLVMIELDLPDQTGFALWRSLQRLLAWAALPCIFIGKDVNEELILQSFEVGAADYVHPPFAQGILFEKIRVLVEPVQANVPRRIQDVLPGTVLDARYRIIRRIGQGGTSEVFLVEDQLNGARRALKLFAPQGQEDIRVEQERFRREIRAQIRLRHPNLVRVYDIGFVGSLYYYTMDYLSEGSLAQRLTQGPLPPKQALWIAAQLASAVAVIHENGLQHRDLKPGNVLFSAAGEPIITDFGLVLDTLAPRLTSPEIIIGTLKYMSPERLTLEDQIDHRSDIYSLGLLLYEMLAGKLPYSSSDPVQMHRVMMSGLPAPTIYQPNIPEAATQICQRATAYTPMERYDDAASLEAALTGALRELAHTRVLLLDDDPMIASVFVSQLEALGMECNVVVDSEAAISEAKAWMPDLCMINVANPRLNGIGVYQALRRIPHLSQMPCIFVAPKWSEENAIKASRMGVSECISKPFSIRHTADKILQLLDRVQRKQRFKLFQPRDVVNQRYELTSLLHRGRLNLVFLALDRQTGGPCILKTIQPSGAEEPEIHWRLLREIEALRQCDHANILPLKGLGRYKGLPYFIAPYIEGETLAECITRRQQLPLSSALALTARLANCLYHLHCRSLLHGYLTPRNVLLSEDGQPMLVDFGESRLLPETIPFGPFLSLQESPERPVPSRTNRPQYMSPEQLQDKAHIDERSDLFGLGLLLYEMLTGIAPLAGNSAKGALRKIQRGGIPSPLKFQPYLPQAAAELCQKLLMADPNKRFMSAALVERACLRLLKQERTAPTQSRS